MEGKTKYLVPSSLGIGLIEGYDKIEFDKSLSKPQLRREVIIILIAGLTTTDGPQDGTQHGPSLRGHQVERGDAGRGDHSVQGYLHESKERVQQRPCCEFDVPDTTQLAYHSSERSKPVGTTSRGE